MTKIEENNFFTPHPRPTAASGKSGRNIFTPEKAGGWLTG